MDSIKTTAYLLVLVLVLAAAGAGCGGDEGTVALSGSITGIDEKKVSWDGLRVAVACVATMYQNGQATYRSGDAVVDQAIGGERTFSLQLPGELDERWFGTELSATSCPFALVAYNDANGNGRLDLAGAGSDPYVRLREGTLGAGMVIFVRSPETWNAIMKGKVSYGWNYSTGLTTYSNDFNRDFVVTGR